MKIVTQLESAQTLQQVKKEHARYVEEVILEGELLEDALEMLNSLGEKLKQEQIRDRKMLAEYMRIIVSLRVRLFSYMPEQKVFNFFRLHFVAAATYDAIGDVSLDGSLRHFFGRYDFVARNAVQQKILQNMRQTTEVIGMEQIDIEGTKVTPQFRNWIRDYTQTVGAGRKVLEGIREYLRLSDNVKKLTREDRAILQRCLKYYELLKVPANEIGSLASKELIAMGFSPEEISGIDEDLFDVFEPEPLLAAYESYEDFKKNKKSQSAQSSQSDGQKRPQRSERTPERQQRTPVSEKRRAEQARSARIERPKAQAEPRPAKPATLTQSPTGVGRLRMPKPLKPVAQNEQDRSKSSLPKPPQKNEVVQSKLEAPQSQTVGQAPEKKVEQSSSSSTALFSSPESLSGLTIDAFRKMGENDADRLQKMKDSVEQMRKAGTSLLPYWQRSPLYRLYLSIGRESMTSDKTVAEIGKTLSERNEPYLTEKEFEIIADLSSQF